MLIKEARTYSPQEYSRYFNFILWSISQILCEILRKSNVFFKVFTRSSNYIDISIQNILKFVLECLTALRTKYPDKPW